MASARVVRPDSVKVGYAPYRIEWLTDEEWKAAGINDDWGGVTQHSHGRIGIRLDGGVPEYVYQEVLLHELLHAVWAVIGLDHEHIHFKDESTREESLVTMQSPTLLAVLKENPHVMKYLMSEGMEVRR